MLELNASAFLGAATNLARMHQLYLSLGDSQNEVLIPESVALLSPPIAQFANEVEKLGARLSVLAARRLLAVLNEEPCVLKVGQLVSQMNEVESRFADYLTELKMFVLDPQEASLLEGADKIIGMRGFAALFPSAAFEIEEACHCVVLGRHTASVFHAMRMLEVGIRALGKRLDIPDPVKPAERNWAIILKVIKDKIDLLWPPNGRLPHSEGAAFDLLYATLDAVRNPWRNATMHVESIYAPHEALHIIRCSAYFMRILAGLTDEEGRLPADPTIEGLLSDGAA